MTANGSIAGLTAVGGGKFAISFYDGAGNNAYDYAVYDTATVNHAPVVTASDVTLPHSLTPVAASTLFSGSDPDGDAITYHIFNSGSGNAHFLLNGVGIAKGTEFDVTAAQLSQLTYQGGYGGTDTVYVRASDGSLSSGYTSFVVTPTPDRAPIVTASNVTLPHSLTPVSVSTLFSASDPDGDPITSYRIFNSGAGGGVFLVNGVAQAKGVEFDVAAANLSQVTYRPGTSADTLYIKATDGVATSAYTSFVVTPTPDRAPIVTASNITLPHSLTPVAASTLFSATDPDGDPIASYRIFNIGSGNAHFLLNGVAQAVGVEFDITADQLSQLTYQGGYGGTDTIYVKASDGTLMTPSYTSFAVTANPDRAPIVTASNVTLPHSLTPVAVSTLFSATDPDGDPITSYRIFNSGAGGGVFLVNGVAQAKGVEFDIAASDLSQLTYRQGTSADTIYVKASDGLMMGSSYTSFVVTPTPDRAPVVNASDVMLPHSLNPEVAASTLFSATDPDGDAVTSYRIFNNGSGGARFVLNGVEQPNGVEFDIAASDLSQLTFRSGTSTDTIYVKASDGVATSASYTAFNVTPGPESAPVVSASNTVLNSGQNTVAAQSLFMANDPDGDAITNYRFFNAGYGDGYFTFNGMREAAGVEFDVLPNQLSQLTYTAGTDYDVLAVKASDGLLTSNYTTFNVSAAPQLTEA